MNIFQYLPQTKVGKNRFDLTHDVKLSFQMGRLVPTLCLDVLPGDTFNINTETMLRMAPMIAPVMHAMHVSHHFFFVPNRILWDGWEDFITGNQDLAPPTFNLPQELPPNSIGAYMGLPTIGDDAFSAPVNALPLAAYALIHDEYYRDQQLVSPIFLNPLVPADNPWVAELAEQLPFARAWEHDYFTSCLPYPQKGDDVLIPLNRTDNLEATVVRNLDGTFSDSASLYSESGQLLNTADDTARMLDNNANAETINSLRRAFRLQEWLEKNARGGTRYIESILSHFGIKSSDARLQRPEYLGGSRASMTISEVLATAQTETTETVFPLGTMAGHGISVAKGNNVSYRAEEHGFIIGIVSVRPKTAYQQGIPRKFTRPTKFDYYWPSFANLGEQEVLNKELYADTEVEDQEAVFGYLPRYSEYRYEGSRVAGDLRESLNFWHMGRIFTGNAPVLDGEFVTCRPTTRIFAVTDPFQDNLIGYINHKIDAVRPLPKFGVPTI